MGVCAPLPFELSREFFHLPKSWGNLKRKLTLQGINISHLGKRTIIFKMPLLRDMLVPWRVSFSRIVKLLIIFWVQYRRTENIMYLPTVRQLWLVLRGRVHGKLTAICFPCQIIYRVLYIPSGAGFLPSTVVPFNIPKSYA